MMRERRWRTASLAVAACLGLIVLSGCGGGDPDPPVEATAAGEVSPGVADAAGVATPAPPVVGDVVWATTVEPGTNAPVEQVDRFPVDAPVIRAVVPVSRLPSGSILVGSWSYNDVPLDGLDTEVTIPTWIDQPIWAEFHLDLDAGERWPEGTYAISISLNGEAVRSATVEVGGDESA